MSDADTSRTDAGGDGMSRAGMRGVDAGGDGMSGDGISRVARPAEAVR